MKCELSLGDQVRIKPHHINSAGRDLPEYARQLILDIRQKVTTNQFRVVGLSLECDYGAQEEYVLVYITNNDHSTLTFNPQTSWRWPYNPKWLQKISPRFEYVIKQLPTVELY